VLAAGRSYRTCHMPYTSVAKLPPPTCLVKNRPMRLVRLKQSGKPYRKPVRLRNGLRDPTTQRRPGDQPSKQFKAALACCCCCSIDRETFRCCCREWVKHVVSVISLLLPATVKYSPAPRSTPLSRLGANLPPPNPSTPVRSGQGSTRLNNASTCVFLLLLSSAIGCWQARMGICQ
jgi:hypothetical protein